jgi:hypothetical protein
MAIKQIRIPTHNVCVVKVLGAGAGKSPRTSTRCAVVPDPCEWLRKAHAGDVVDAGQHAAPGGKARAEVYRVTVLDPEAGDLPPNAPKAYRDASFKAAARSAARKARVAGAIVAPVPVAAVKPTVTVTVVVDAPKAFKAPRVSKALSGATPKALPAAKGERNEPVGKTVDVCVQCKAPIGLDHEGSPKVGMGGVCFTCGEK